MNMTQTNFNEYQERNPAQIVHEIRKLTIITAAELLIHEIGKQGVTRIVNVPFSDNPTRGISLMVDKYYVFKGEPLYVEIKGRPTVEIEYLKTDEKL